MPQSDQHNATFDYARLIAVIGIIWFHAKAPGGVVGYSGLAFFLLLVVVFAMPQIGAMRARAHRAPPLWRYAAARGQRLLLPWLIASGLYGGLKLLEMIRGAPWQSEFSAQMWITGTALHLWFLPFAFVVCIALWPICRWAVRLPLQMWPWLSLFFAGVALYALALLHANDLPDPLAQWAYATPIVCIGLSCVFCRGKSSQTLGVLGLFVFSALAFNLTAGLLEITIAGLCLVACLAVPLKPTVASAWCARASLFVYLIHPAVMTLIERSGAMAERSIGLMALTTVLSLLAVAIWETMALPRRSAKLLTS